MLVRKTLLILALMFIALAPYVFEIYKEYSVKGEFAKQGDWKGVIVLWDFSQFDKQDGTRFGGLRDKIYQFEKENPGVYIEFKPIEKEEGIIELKTAIESGTAPDIVPMGAEKTLADAKYLEPLDSFFETGEKENYFSNVLEAVRSNGKIFGFPAYINTYVLIFDKEIADASGLTYPKEIQWSCDLFEKCLNQVKDKKIIKLDITKEAASHFAKSIKNQKEWNTFIGRVGFANNANMKLASKIMKGIGKNGGVLSAVCSTMDTARLQYYTAGVFKHKIYQLTFDDKRLSGECVAYGITKQKDHEKLKMCVKFAKFLADDESQKKLSQYHAFPTKKSVGSIYGDKSDLSKIEKLIQNNEINFVNYGN